MVINNYTNNYTLSSYNMQQKVGIMHSIRIKTSYPTYFLRIFKLKKILFPIQYSYHE